MKKSKFVVVLLATLATFTGSSNFAMGAELITELAK